MTTQPTFDCPVCFAISYNPNDIEHGYCGRCHAFTRHACRISYTDMAFAIRELSPSEMNLVTLADDRLGLLLPSGQLLIAIDDVPSLAGN